MQLPALLGLIGCWLYLLAAANGASEGSDGVDLSLRLGPRPATARFPQGNVVSDPAGRSRQPVGSMIPEIAQTGHDQPGASTSSRRLMQGSGEASAIGGVGTHMDRWQVESSNQVIQRLEAHESWQDYTRKYLDRPIEPFVHDGWFIPQKALEFQTRIDLLVITKRLWVRRYGHLMGEDELITMRKSFKNWRKMSRSIAPDEASVRVEPELVYKAHTDIVHLRKKEDIIRRVALIVS